MKNILILDTETTGVDPKVDAVIEVGCILYSVEHVTPIEYYAALIRHDSNAAESINRISIASLADARPAPVAWERVQILAEKADAIVAHNAPFDFGFSPVGIREAAPWICSMSDLAWPKQGQSRSLVSLTLDHDLGIVMAHRALSDCDMLARLFTRAHELGCDLSAMLARGLRPKALFQAIVSFDDKDKAKAAGFQWEAPTKRWLRTMAIEDAAALPFRTVQA